MLIVCPACDARYAVDDALIGPEGRAVRCSACHAEWTARPGETTPATRTDGEPIARAERDRVRPSGAPERVEPTAEDEIGDERGGDVFWVSEPRDHALASTLEEPRAPRGGVGFLAGFVLSTTAALLAALAYLRAEDIAAAAPAVAPQIEAYRAWIDALRAAIAAALAAAR